MKNFTDINESKPENNQNVIQLFEKCQKISENVIGANDIFFSLCQKFQSKEEEQ